MRQESQAPGCVILPNAFFTTSSMQGFLITAAAVNPTGVGAASP